MSKYIIQLKYSLHPSRQLLQNKPATQNMRDLIQFLKIYQLLDHMPGASIVQGIF